MSCGPAATPSWSGREPSAQTIPGCWSARWSGGNAGLRPGRAISPRRVTITRSGALDPQALFFAAAADQPLVRPDRRLTQLTQPTEPPDRLHAHPDRLIYPELPLVYTVPAGAAGLAAQLAGAAVVVPVPAELSARGSDDLDLRWILADLASRGVGRLLVEGGAHVLAQFLSAGLADEFLLAIAPMLVADTRAPRLLAGGRPAGRMTLAGVTMAGDMAVLHYLLQAAQAADQGESAQPTPPAEPEQPG